MKRMSTHNNYSNFLVFDTVSGNVYTSDGTQRMLYNEEVRESHRKQEISHIFRAFQSTALEGEFDSDVLMTEHIPELERCYGGSVFHAGYPIQNEKEWDGSYYTHGVFAIVPSVPDAVHNLALLEYEIWIYLDELIRLNKSCHVRTFEHYDPIFYVFNNGVLRTNWKYFMSCDEWDQMLDDNCCHISWDVMDRLQAICEKYGYLLK